LAIGGAGVFVVGKAVAEVEGCLVDGCKGPGLEATYTHARRALLRQTKEGSSLYGSWNFSAFIYFSTCVCAVPRQLYAYCISGAPRGVGRGAQRRVRRRRLQRELLRRAGPARAPARPRAPPRAWGGAAALRGGRRRRGERTGLLWTWVGGWLSGLGPKRIHVTFHF
jgi:hypothetical protein